MRSTGTVTVFTVLICVIPVIFVESCTKVELEDGKTRIWKLSKNVPKALKGLGKQATLSGRKDNTFKIAVKNDILFDVLQMCLRVRRTAKVVFRLKGEDSSKKTVDIDVKDQDDFKSVCSQRGSDVSEVTVDFERGRGGKSQVSGLFMEACLRDRMCGSLNDKDLFKVSKDAEKALKDSGKEFTAQKKKDASIFIEARNEGSTLEVEKLCFQVRGAKTVFLDLPGNKKTINIDGEERQEFKRICVKGRNKEESSRVAIRFKRSKGFKVQVKNLEMDGCVRSFP